MVEEPILNKKRLERIKQNGQNKVLIILDDTSACLFDWLVDKLGASRSALAQSIIRQECFNQLIFDIEGKKLGIRKKEVPL